MTEENEKIEPEKIEQPSEPVQPAAQEIKADDKNLAVLTHLLSLFLGFIPGLIFWLVYKESNEYVSGQGKEALNFQITLILGYIIAWLTSWILIGTLLFPILIILNLVFCIMGAVASSKGEYFKYPLSIRLLS